MLHIEHIRVYIGARWFVVENSSVNRFEVGYILRYMGRNDRAAGDATAALAAAIREVQGDRDLSTAKLSRESTIPYSTLRRIRTGKQPIDWEELTKLAKALNIGVAELALRAEKLSRPALEEAE